MHHFSHYRIRLASFALIAALAVLVPMRAHALTLSPSKVEVSGDAGQTITRTIVIVNETDKSETYYASYANFEAQGESGTPVFVEPSGDLGTWMRVEPSLTLRAGESREVTLTISIPSGAEPGGHFAVVFWGTTPPGQSGAISVGSQTALLVLLSVSGEIREEFGLVDFKVKGGQWLFRMLPVGFEYRFSNQGGDRVKPVASITVRSILGWRVKKIDANPFEGNVLPNTTRKFSPEWAKRDPANQRPQDDRENYSFVAAVKDEWHNFAIGIFRAQLSVEFGTEDDRTKSGSVYFVVFPWELILVIVPGAFILFLLLRFFVRRYNKSIIRNAQASLAKERGV